MNQSKMPISGDKKKTFVLKHVFQEGDNYEKSCGPEESRFGLAWRLSSYWDFNDTNYLTLECRKIEEPNERWAVKTNITIEYPKYARKNEAHEFNQNKQSITLLRTKFDELEKYGEYPKFTIECHVTLDEMTGDLEKKKLRNFDESMKEFSDVVLVVGGEKFYVLKKFLAAQSTYFNGLFSGNFSESQKSEIELKDIDSDDFQNLLELLHGDSFIDDDSVEGILNLADFLDSRTALNRCDEFLLNRSKLSLKSKFQAAIKYRLDELKKKCMSEMKTKEDVMSVLPEDPTSLHGSIWAELMQKMASFT